MVLESIIMLINDILKKNVYYIHQRVMDLQECKPAQHPHPLQRRVSTHSYIFSYTVASRAIFLKGKGIKRWKNPTEVIRTQC